MCVCVHRADLRCTHFDTSENLMLCVCGSKRLWLYPPSDTPYVYPAAQKERTSRADVPPFCRVHELPHELRETFAAVAHASPVEVVLRAGDLLYLPAGWWHCVEGSTERNMILNWWYFVHPQKAARDPCGPARKWKNWVHTWPAP